MTIGNRIATVLASVLVAVGSVQLIAVEKAEAFEFDPDSYLLQGVVDLSDCDLRLGGLDYTDEGSYCHEADSADDTFFYKESGKRAYKVEIISDGELGAKLECHPSTNRIWVYDTDNDGDGYYWELYGTVGVQFLSAPGTSAEIEYNTFPSSGDINTVKVWDDAGMTDLITTLSWGSGPLCKL